MESEFSEQTNATKTRILVCSKGNNIRTRIKLTGNKVIRQIHDFRYLRIIQNMVLQIQRDKNVSRTDMITNEEV